MAQKTQQPSQALLTVQKLLIKFSYPISRIWVLIIQQHGCVITGILHETLHDVQMALPRGPPQSVIRFKRNIRGRLEGSRLIFVQSWSVQNWSVRTTELNSLFFVSSAILFKQYSHDDSRRQD